MKKKTSLPIILGYIYIVLPILIFIIGYCNIPTAVIGTLIICISFYFMCKNTPKIWIPSTKKEILWLILTAIICFIWVYSSGIGALVFQNLDHNCRNPIFEYMVTENWPVISETRTFILTYYIGFWFPAAVIGKLFNSIQIGYYTQVFWAFCGVFLTIYYILACVKKKNLIPVLIFIFFSGLDIIGSILLFDGQHNPFILTRHLEWWFHGFQFSSMTTQLYWVFNQAIPAWIITMLLFNEKNNKNIIFIYSCLLICSSLPAFGVLPFVIWWGIKNGENNLKNIFKIQNLIKSIQTGVSFQNIIGGIFISVVSYTYLSNNLSGAVRYIQTVNIYYWLIWFLLFFMLEAGFYLICIFYTHKKEPLYYICTLSLLIFPFIHIGYSADFCMRASIPALVILCLFIIQALESSEFVKKKVLYGLLIILLAIGSITPIHEISRTVINTSRGIIKQPPALEGSNFFGYTENNSFLKYFGKFKN